MKNKVTTLVIAIFFTLMSVVDSNATTTVSTYDFDHPEQYIISTDPADLLIEPEEVSYSDLPIEEHISRVCEDYGIDDKIPLAIARLETGHFTSNAYVNQNNPGGISVNEQPLSYDTIEEGVDAFISNLANNYFGIGLTTPETIAKKYCPVNADHWANLVRQLM